MQRPIWLLLRRKDLFPRELSNRFGRNQYHRRGERGGEGGGTLARSARKPCHLSFYGERVKRPKSILVGTARATTPQLCSRAQPLTSKGKKLSTVFAAFAVPGGAQGTGESTLETLQWPWQRHLLLQPRVVLEKTPFL